MKQKTMDLAAALQAESSEDLFNTLMEISDIAKRLAKKMTKYDKETKKWQRKRYMDYPVR